MTLRNAFLTASLVSTLAATPAPSNSPEPPTTAISLFAAVEEAWSGSDAERLGSLVDTTAVRISIKPGTPLATAPTRVAVTFLLQDQLRLVHTSEFRVTRFDCDAKRGICRAYATWNGDWGGRQGTRAAKVTLTARPRSGRWLLTEIRAD